MIHFHGNGETIDDYVPWFPELLEQRGLNTFLAEYRGYGASTGVPLYGRMLDDTEAIFERGILQKETKRGKAADQPDGTLVEFRPDIEIFGDHAFNYEYVEQRLWNYACLNSGLRLLFRKPLHHCFHLYTFLFGLRLSGRGLLFRRLLLRHCFRLRGFLFSLRLSGLRLLFRRLLLHHSFRLCRFLFSLRLGALPGRSPRRPLPPRAGPEPSARSSS